MSGLSALQRPDNPGTYITLVGQRTVRPPASIAEKIAIPIICDWGPVGSEDGVQECDTFGEFEELFGDSDTAGRDAVLSAFIGSGIAGGPAAGAVIVYRMATGSAAASTITLKNVTGEGENALKLTAANKGTRGDRISVAVAADPITEGKHRFSVLFDGLVKERYSFAKEDLASLVARITASSNLITAEVVKDGAALATTAGTALAGGDDGDELTSEEWAAALDALEFIDFSVFAPYDLTDEGIRATVYAWTQAQAEAMRPVTTFLGGPTEESLTDAIERAAEIPDPHVVAIGGGDFHDDFLDKDLTTSQLAPRVAGIFAGLGEARSLLNAAIAGLHQIGTEVVAPDELSTAAEHGVTVFKRTTRADTELVIANGVTTFVDDTDEARPLELFSDPRLVRVGDLFIRRMKEWGDINIVGPTTVTEETEAAVRNQGQAELNDLIDRQLILPGATADEKPFFRIVSPGASGIEDAIVFEFGWKYARTTKYLIGLGKVR